MRTPILRSAPRNATALAACAAALASIALAGPPPQPAAPAKAEKVSPLDPIWKAATLYQNEKNTFLQKLAFTGRAQFDYAWADSDRGDFDDWFVRRLRLGFKADILREFTLHAEVDIDPQYNDPVYQRLTDVYLSWSRDEKLEITIGKQSAPFTLDGATSSKRLITVDRNNVTNNLWFPYEYMPGISAAGKIDRWHYFAGLYSSGDETPEFGEFNAGLFTLASLGYDLSKSLGAKEAIVALQYVYNDPDENNGFTRSLEHVASLNLRYDTGKWGARAEVAGGIGYGGQGDMIGVVLMPFYHITKHLQAVARYTHIDADDPGGIRLNRYENQILSARGDRYDEFYLGLNWFLHGHDLKLQTGIQYAVMEDSAGDKGDFAGWAWTTGLRIAW